jgi:hypothetical protein
MRVQLQVRHMWLAVRYVDVDYYEDRRALDALIAAVPPEIQFSLSQKRTAKEAWYAIATARIGSDRARKTTLQALRKEWENLAFKPGEDVDDFALRLNTLFQKMVQFGDDTYDEERAVEKLFHCIPEKYKQIARSIESLLDLSTMTIEEAIGQRLVVSRLSTATNHRPSLGLSPSVGSYISLGSSGRPVRVTTRGVLLDMGPQTRQATQGARRRLGRGLRTS